MEREVIGPYRIVRVLGKGGMGTVYEAFHEEIERQVAIKVLHPELAADREHADRFVNEAKAANRINHPGIVQIYEIGRLPDGTTYLVMELLVGETLGQRLKRRGGTLPIDEALAITKDIGEALAVAHAKNIIHRDLKPENVMLISDSTTQRGERLKLLDFGIAKLTVSTGGKPSAQTQFGAVMGTLWYMSPEQLRDTAQVNDRTDVYALGIVLYQLVSGQVPFVAGSEVELMAAHLRDAPRDLRELRPDVPEFVALLVSEMLAKDPATRPSMLQVLRALSGGTTGSGTVRLPVSGERPTPDSARGGMAPATVARRPSSRSPAAEAKGELAADSGSSRLSTLSGSASEPQPLPGHPATRWHRLAILPAGVLTGLTLILLLSAGRHPKPPPLPAPASIGPVTPSAPPPPAVPPTKPPTTPELATAPELVTAPKPSTEAPPGGKPKVVPCKPEAPAEKCVHGKLPPGMNVVIVKSLRGAGIRLCPGEVLQLRRFGNHMLFENYPSRVTPGVQTLFGDTFQGNVGSTNLPEAFTVQCGRGKGPTK